MTGKIIPLDGARLAFLERQSTRRGISGQPEGNMQTMLIRKEARSW